MRVFYEKITPTENKSFSCNESFDFSKVAYHHHREIEITFIANGEGQRCIGNHIATFNPGDLVICGSMLPHVWIPSPECVESQRQHSFVLQFEPDLFGENFWSSKEIEPFSTMIQQSVSGIECKEHDYEKTQQYFQNILHSNELESLSHLLSFWNYLLSLNWSKALSLAPERELSQNQIPIIEKVIEYLLHHYSQNIRQPELAEMSSMSVSHFSRFFKKSTGYSFSDYLNRIRIDQACQRIKTTDLNIAQVAFDVGYNNLSQFNLNFKKFCNMTPKAYQKNFQFMN